MSTELTMSRTKYVEEHFAQMMGILCAFGVIFASEATVAQTLPPRTVADEAPVEVQNTVLENAVAQAPAKSAAESKEVTSESSNSELVAESADTPEAALAVEAETTEAQTAEPEVRVEIPRVRDMLSSAVDASRNEADTTAEKAELAARRAEFDAFFIHADNLVSTIRTDSRETFSRIMRNPRAQMPSREGLFVLRPYVDDPRWMTAMRQLEEDECAKSLATLEELFGEDGVGEDADPAIRYAHARVQMCAGEASQGKSTLAELASGQGPIAHLARVRLGQKSSAGKDASYREGEYLSQKLADAKRGARKDLAAAIASLDELHSEMTSSWDRYRVRLTQAEIYESAQKIDEAGNAYLQLYRRTRGWKVNSLIEDRLEKLERRHKKSFLSYGERIDRMRHLISRGRYSQARRVSVENAKLRGVKGNEIRGWARYRKALQYEREKKRTKAVELFESANKLVRDSEVRPRLYFGWARALRRLDRDREAIDLYGKICKEYPKHHLCDDATYEAGRLLQFLEDHDEAQKRFAWVIDNTDGENVPDALWRSAFSYYLSGQWDKAIARLETLRKDHYHEADRSELSLGLKASYWIATSHLKAGRLGEARVAFQDTIDRGQLTWYGRLADARMRENGWTPRIELPRLRLTQEDLEDLSQLRVSEHPRLEVAAELVRLGLWEHALAELKDQRAIHPVPDGTHRMLAAVYLARGDANWSHWIMKKHIAEAGPRPATMRDWGTAFPLNYMDLAHKFGTKYNVSPFLVQAIIRQESGFRPEVKSWAGAIGLMQMMPRTARWTTKTFMQEKRFRRSQLKDPETNVKLGSMYIRIHTAHAADQIPLALAGYNAGAGALESWFRRYGDRELDAFVESITYQEARGYVRKVFTSYTAYSALYSGRLPEVDLKLPEKLRKWGEIPEVDEPVSQRPVDSRTFAHGPR